jgi:hypothetical protein
MRILQSFFGKDGSLVIKREGITVAMRTKYEVECYGPDGVLKWRDGFENLVVTAGLDKILDACFKTGLAAPAWYVGLKDTGTPAAADTMASHVTWVWIDNYTGDRQAFTPGTISAGSVSNSAAKAVFPITGDDTIYGCGLCDSATGDTGVLYGAGDFTAPRAVLTGDTLNVQVTLTAVAA